MSYQNPFQKPEEEFLFLMDEYKRLLELKEEYKKRGIKNYLSLLKQIDNIEKRLLELEVIIGEERINEIMALRFENRLKQENLL